MKSVIRLLIPFLAFSPFVHAGKPQPPVDEFLSVFDLSVETGANPLIEQDLLEFADQSGLVIKRVEIPAKKPISLPPTGLDILRFELADTSRFDFVSVKDGPVIAIYPVLTEQALAEAKDKKLCYFDLSPFGAAVPETAAGDATIWKEAGDQIRSWREKVKIFDRFVNPQRRLQPAYANRSPYGRATFDEKNERLVMEEFDLLEVKAIAALGSADTHELIFPIFPTVYSPVCHENRNSDTKVATHVLRQINKLMLKDGDQVLDVGTGSGFLAWLAWKAARAHGADVVVYALDINPVAVANARYIARLVGYQITSKTFDNIMDKNGSYAFPNKRFRFVIWNMPSVPSQSHGDLKAPGTFEDYWDQGPNGLDVLKRFSAGLKGLLDPTVRKKTLANGDGTNSIALIWNLVPQVEDNIVERTFKKVGLKTKMLEQYEDYGAQCVIYALH
jgi:methylase of polypeptide subunit release factors